MSSITKANAVFPDQQQTEEYLKTLSPRTVRKFWKFVSSDELRKYPSYSQSPFKELRIAGVGVLTARVFALAQRWSKGSLEAGDFRNKIMYLSEEGCIDLFEQLPVKTQEDVWIYKYPGHHYLHLLCIERGYLKLLRKTNLPAKFSFQIYTTNDLLRTEILEPVVKAMKDQGSTLDLEVASNEFNDSINTLFANERRNLNQAHWNEECLLNFGPRALDAVLMLRALYGEQAVLDAFRWVIDAGLKICLEEAVLILDSWEEFSQYPAEWVANVQGFEHHMQYDTASEED